MSTLPEWLNHLDLYDDLAFYSDSEVESMFAEWGHFYDLLDLQGIENELSPEALKIRPKLSFSFCELQQELFRRQNRKE